MEEWEARRGEKKKINSEELARLKNLLRTNIILNMKSSPSTARSQEITLATQM